MAAPAWFCRDAEECSAICERLKLTPCPHCRRVGMLIRHGFLRGRDEIHTRKDTVRAQRVLCSNRNRRQGCGRTFGIWYDDKIRRLGVTTGCLWRFLKLAVAGGVAAASRALSGQERGRTWQRIWQRFNHGQSHIRTALSARCPPPESAVTLPAEASRRPAAQIAGQVLAHLQAAFPDADCPIAAFQHTLGTFFV